MVSLVTLDQVKIALRIGAADESPIPPHEDDVVLEQTYIPAASAIVIRYLKSQAEVIIPGLAESPQSANGCPEFVQVAVFEVVKMLYDGADDEMMRRIERGYLPSVASALLYQFRDPALA